MAGRYDIVFTAPHFALRAIDSGHFVPLAIPTNPLSACVVVAVTSPIKAVTQLNGKNIATPPTDAIITIAGRRYLVHAGIDLDKTNFIAFSSHNAAYQSVLGGDFDAALISSNIFNRALSRGVALRSVACTREFPGVTYLAATDLPQSLRDKIQRTLVGMSGDPEGRKVLAHVKHPAYRAVTASEFKELRNYLH